jgi:hypothetical protein
MLFFNSKASAFVFDAKRPLPHLRMRNGDNAELSKIVNHFRELFDKDNNRCRTLNSERG